MPVTLLSSEVPAVIAASGFVDLDAAENATGAGGAIGARKFSQGDTTTVPNSLNRNVCAQELGVRYGGGLNGIGYGMDPSAGTGLEVLFEDGHVVVDGAVVQFADGSVSGIANNARSYFWVIDNEDGTFSLYHATSTTTPTGAVCYVGSALTAGGVVSSVDTSGVVYLRGIPYRETADVGPPTDTPPARALITRTYDGVWLWDGAEWSRTNRALAHQSQTVASGKTELVPAGRQAVIYDEFDVVGTLDVYGTMLVVA